MPPVHALIVDGAGRREARAIAKDRAHERCELGRTQLSECTRKIAVIVFSLAGLDMASGRDIVRQIAKHQDGQPAVQYHLHKAGIGRIAASGAVRTCYPYITTSRDRHDPGAGQFNPLLDGSWLFRGDCKIEVSRAEAGDIDTAV